MTAEQTLSSMRTQSIAHLKNAKALEFLAKFVDAAGDAKSIDDIRHCQIISQEIEARKLPAKQKSELYYYIANSWSVLRTAQNQKSIRNFSWEIPELEKELIYLRRSAYGVGFGKLSPGRKCQILTNLAGQLSQVGRIIEAIECWDKALSIGSFGMAHGNRGIGLHKYARNLYNQGHAQFIAYEARRSLELSCVSPTTQPDALSHFRQELTKLSKIQKPKLKTDKLSLGSTAHEIGYRKWCLENRLFLNPLNDLGSHPQASKDVFGLPSLTSKLPRQPVAFGFFNILKQEYVSARYLLFSGLNTNDVHLSDRNVTLYNTLDYPSLSFGTELTRLAYRSAYSILDKVAYFIRDYFRLKIKERRTYFRSVWYIDGEKKKGLVPKFRDSKNLPLLGLFWLSKDLFEDSREYQDAIAPDAQSLHDIRNYLEHKYLSIHTEQVHKNRNSFGNKAMLVTVDEFNEKALVVLRLTRSALMYLSMAIYIEEQKNRKNAKPSVSMIVDTYEDEWKRRW